MRSISRYTNQQSFTCFISLLLLSCCYSYLGQSDGCFSARLQVNALFIRQRHVGLIVNNQTNSCSICDARDVVVLLDVQLQLQPCATIACTCTVDDFSLRFQAFFLISPVSGPSTPVWRIGDLLPELKV